MTEKQVITAFEKMCRESITPDAYSKLADTIIPQLENNRSDLSREVEIADDCGLFGPDFAKERRIELGLTCREVAVRAGMYPSHVSEFEQGKHVLTLAEGNRLRAVLEIQPNL